MSEWVGVRDGLCRRGRVFFVSGRWVDGWVGRWVDVDNDIQQQSEREKETYEKHINQKKLSQMREKT